MRISTRPHAFVAGAGSLVIVIGVGIADPRPALADDPTLAPPFSAETLDAYPRDAWITNGGNLANQRYSPLDQIDRDNVASLKAEWRASLEGSGVTPRGSNPDYEVEPTDVYSGGVVHSSSIPRRGIFAALDVTTNRLEWRQQWPEQCYSGSMTTAGGLVFVGRNDGRLTALDTRNGDKLWEFQTDGGVNAPAISFEHEGTQYVASYAGGTSLAPSKRSDGVWLYSLDGAIESLPPGSADPGGQFPGGGGGGPPGPDDADGGDDEESDGEGSPFLQQAERAPDLEAGRAEYAATCVTCHGEDGQGGTHGGSAFTTDLTLGAIMSALANGRGDMPAYGGVMSPQELLDVAGYVHEELRAE